MAGKSQQEREILQFYFPLIEVAHGQFVANVVNQVVETRAMLSLHQQHEASREQRNLTVTINCFAHDWSVAAGKDGR